MSGRVRETCISAISDKHDPEQITFGDYGSGAGATTIAVVSEPTDEMLELTDECITELGMPEKYLERFWKRRSEYRLNSAIDDPHNRAYEDLHLDQRYQEYIRESDEAQSSLSEIVERVKNGESITLVCFESDGEHCHRHVLRSMIEKRIQYDFSAKERVSPE